MISPIPMIASDTSTSGTSSSSSAPQNTPSNTLGPDSFITLLTAQLQAQDPLSPMDPDQMVNELTSINTLQQIMQIRTDMDTLVGATQPAQSGTGSASTTAANSITSALPPSAVRQYSQFSSNSPSL